ncbi:MAG: galactose-1-epimerase [Xanthomonadales bacterium]|nr:galactose mutarotase [Xanthomonadales bacterium]NIX12742.1 galactose-1-epimerase [Xanthomonadales bacterium]
MNGNGGSLPGGGIESVKLANAAGLEVELLNLGASIRSLRVPSENGRIDAVLGYPRVEDYAGDTFCLGATAGRYANRIANACFKLDGREHRLAASSGQAGHCLHGGPGGFSRRLWSIISTDDPARARFRLISPHGDQGFPGQLAVEVTYRLLEGWRLEIVFQAESDAPTVVNLANHAYFNLNSDGSPADNHLVRIRASRFTPVEQDLIPTGELRDVVGTPFDFRNTASFRDRLEEYDEQLSFGGGFDHNYVLDGGQGELQPAAELSSPQSKLTLRVYTTQAGLQWYTGQHLGRPFRPFQGVCLEAQGFPNAPNTPGFPDTTLRPGEHYAHTTIYELLEH